MTYFIVGWIILWISSGCIGMAILNYLGNPIGFRIGDRIILSQWIGLMLLSMVLLTVSLVLPLSPWIGIGVTGCMVGGALLPAQNRQTLRSLIHYGLSIGKLRWVQCIVLLGGWAIAAITTRQVTWLDAGLYHVGTIQWLSDFGAVPGVALIHHRFSFTSSWFALAAPFNPSRIHFQAVAIANSFLMLLIGIHLIVALRHIVQRVATLADWFISIFYLAVFLSIAGISLMVDITVSPSPDTPILLLAGITSWVSQILHTPSSDLESHHSLTPRTFQSEFAPILILFGVSAIAIKLSGIPILAVVLPFYARMVNFQMRSLLQAIVMIVLGLMPVALFGIITSGCAFYPSHTLCVDLPWSIPSDQANQELASIQGWTKWFGEPPPGTPYFPWVLLQWLRQSSANLLMAALLSLSFLAGSIGFIFWRKAIVQHLNLTVILGLFGSTFIMLTAPGLRFGLGYLILVPAWILAVLCSHLSIVQRILTFLNHAIARLVHSSKMRYLPYLCLGCILTISVAYPPLRQQIVLPPPLPDANVAEAQINNIEYTYTDTDEVLCWAMPQPCAIGPIEANIQLRYPNRGLGAGFEYAQR